MSIITFSVDPNSFVAFSRGDSVIMYGADCPGNIVVQGNIDEYNSEEYTGTSRIWLKKPEEKTSADPKNFT